MPGPVRCPNAACGKSLVVPDAAPGEALVCPACGQPLPTPDRAGVPTGPGATGDPAGQQPPSRAGAGRSRWVAAALVVLVWIAYAVGSLVVGRLPRGPGGEVWRPFTSEAGRFTVEAPGEPRLRQQVIPTPAGAVTFHIWMFKSADGRQQLAAAYGDCPDDFDDGPPGSVFDGSRDRFLGGTSRKVIRETDLTLDGHPGRELAVEISEPLHVLSVQRFYRVNKRMYLLMVMGPFEQDNTAERAEFFGSFRILPAGPGE